ncbi:MULTISPECIES: hypothetical protein [Streptomyces]|uniref:Uncharacterized protein n=1 Tax=Streptomyces stelliscabiei TaxID=146820 RepID=A0A8I0PB31_9ACTN|nr:MULTISPECIES: hypothetical protein [Streptomyces]MBE1600369.1 hypothetical protein [Streptomyces stelliscabiei]MDX2522236.1 hypothetical protein [Streptomyces stelliscabiei]MDX2557796.1 hypothetical protein [Streptomyces stelliscabiei]MDX2617452.1 hypothetical protein [Streptomyces stelliscabiei]MDX2641728.1 hypothetical protein [Streptomyces stelliscabiei]
MEKDPWIPLKIIWHVDRGVQPLYLLVEGSDGGYVELKLHPDTGALMSLIIVDLPAEKGYDRKDAADQVFESFTPTFDVIPWGPASGVATERRVVRVVRDLSYSQVRGRFSIVFLEDSAESVIKCGPVSIEISKDGAFVRLVSKIDTSSTV